MLGVVRRRNDSLCHVRPGYSRFGQVISSYDLLGHVSTILYRLLQVWPG
jgi:hypothetical protein